MIPYRVSRLIGKNSFFKKIKKIEKDQELFKCQLDDENSFDFGVEKIRKVFDINYFVPLAIIKKISKIMIRQRDGIIINMASVAGIEHQPGRVAYGSSKAALIWATQGLAKELGAFNIRVNAIAPGAVKTEMTAGYSEDKIKKIIAETALHRMGDMIDIANVVLFLCSKEASFINGQVIKVDGGR